MLCHMKTLTPGLAVAAFQCFLPLSLTVQGPSVVSPKITSEHFGGLVWQLVHFNVLLKKLFRLCSPKARVRFTCITIETSLVPIAILNLVQHI